MNFIERLQREKPEPINARRLADNTTRCAVAPHG